MDFVEIMYLLFKYEQDNKELLESMEKTSEEFPMENLVRRLPSRVG